ncbi:hypothetical protein NLI96_g6058 [Meripilus lineatus]|uniref:Hydrophobin n=1 Tax=Meripilus lineatus TaxID=2056292 RepID=A0AAD5V701_9APHY|nr:hypothetical protein NLI96_g6058 [Physisporinus lineatus]
MRAVAIVSILASLPALVAATCAAPRPLQYCCRSLQPYYKNKYVWENICGYSGVADQNVPVAGGCAKLEPCNIYGLYNVCCESLIPCPSSTDGVIGLNCTGTQNQ